MIKAAIFDLDGTLTKFNLDINRIKEEIGGSAEKTILETIESLSGSNRQNLEFLKKKKIKTALVTRNNRAVVTRFDFEAGRKAGLTNEAGWMPVDSKTLKTRHENVYAVGDVAAIKLPGKYKPDVSLFLPKAGVFAHYQAEVVAHNIAAEIKGGEKKEFDGKGFCFLEMGGGIAGYASGDFYTEPSPRVNLRKPGRLWRWGKVLFEKYWFWKWF